MLNTATTQTHQHTHNQPTHATHTTNTIQQQSGGKHNKQSTHSQSGKATWP